ncbi:3-deoxy-8-phosphooctulonate synthase [Candidatus Sumerlaeota bacterium]|nr:3-deoxy-8-phosphooctulonate synthase [Candidatus Sumerlaeota bacterium]
MVGNVPVGGDAPLCIFAGPCVIESEDHVLRMAERLKAICADARVPLVFKASYDKANRTSERSFRGPGLVAGLKIFARIKKELGLPILTDVHEADQARDVAGVCDILQIPAFLCRQTDFVHAVGRAGKPVNVKKGQFLAPWDVKNIAEKLREVGCKDIVLTERGSSFGYGQLVTDFRSLVIMREQTGLPVCFDGTHSVQEPGALGNATGGQRKHVPLLCRAACAVGVNALFIETHDDPDKAKSDGPNMVPLSEMGSLLETCRALDEVARRHAGGC